MNKGAITNSAWTDPFRLVLLAPIIFVLHVAEETAGGFVGWFNSLVQPSINVGLFLTVNAICFAITLLLALGAARSRSSEMLSLIVGWLVFLMFANGLFHIIGTLRFSRYSPGTLTAIGLYLPYTVVLTAMTVGSGKLRLVPFLAILALAGIPGTIHFYRILFEGGRLL